MLLAAVGAWLLDTRRRRRTSAYACWRWRTRFSYNRTFPVMAWEPLAELAERARPGRLAALLEEYDGRPGRELTGEVADLLAEVADAAQIFRLKLRTDSGAKIATTTAQPSSAQPTSAVNWPSLARTRTAETTWRDRVELGEGLQPVRHRVGRDERVGQERQREHHHQRVALHAPGRSCRRCRTR